MDGNEAAASVAYRLNEICCIYPITPSSTMAELADQWSSERRPNVWGTVPTVVEMQSEGGAAGALHGSLQAGALATTFTSSQGLLLMLPNMYKIAGELTPAVFHVAARSLAAQGLSIFGDHSDVMAARGTGFALLASDSVQEAHDLAVVAQAATLRSRVPFIHFFDGFRTSHELNTIEPLSDDDLRALVSEELVHAHRGRALSPDRPFIRGTAQNPDTYFQSRETVNPYYARTAEIVQGAMDELAERVGRAHALVSYHGHPEAERVLVLAGSGAVTARRTVQRLASDGERVGALQIRLIRPFPARQVLAALPPTARRVAVLDRTKEPGSEGEPLFLDVVAALGEAHTSGERDLPLVVGGRYGLSSKEFTPAMVAGVLHELTQDRPRRRVTVGITDDVGGTSISIGAPLDIEPPGTVRAVFFGLGSDGTVGANKNTIKILGDAGLCAQGYFVYDSKKSGSQTVSHLRFGDEPIEAPYLVTGASFVGCHQFGLLSTIDVLGRAADGATLLLDCPDPPDEVWDALPLTVQKQVLARGIEVFAIDATRVAREAGLPGRTNTVLQTCFFALSGVLPRDEAIMRIKEAIEHTYARRGADVVDRNNAAVDSALEALHAVEMPGRAHVGARHALAGARLGARVRPLGDRHDAGRPRRRAARERVTGRRHLPERHGGVREAQHLRPRGRVGSRHLHPVRQLQLRLPALGHPLALLRAGRGSTAPRTGFPLRRSTHAASPTRGSRCRCTSRTARAAPSASRHVPSTTRPSPPGRRSTSRLASRWSTPNGNTSRSSRRCPSTTAPAWTTPAFVEPSSSSRCSSSRERAPGAARRRT